MQGEERKLGPEIQTIESIKLPEVQRLDDDGCIPVYFIEGGTEQICRLECVFPAGRKFEKKRAVAALTSALLQEGTDHKSAEEIAELLDFYGFRFKVRNDFDYAYVSINCLSKYFDIAMDLFFEIVKHPVFNQKELDVAKSTASNRLKIQLERNEFVAYRLITESIFGNDHAYGYNTEPNDFEAVSREDLVHFYRENYRLENAFVLLSGQLTLSHQKALLQHLDIKAESKKQFITGQVIGLTINNRIDEKIENSLQTSIKIAQKTFSRKHKDFEGLYILSTILGGYFGSRLMQSIREKHGFSYSVYSALELLEEDGYLCISTEVGSQYTEDALKAIFLELEKLQNEIVPEEELVMVKNYLLGKMLRELDGPFNRAAALRSLLVTQGEIDDLPRFVDRIRSISAQELQELAKQYFDKQSFTTVIVS